ncbi:hypothetical protein SI65_05920 [Aspergillus cristatus]|uniref:Uncharacterized protein n=1 Tax=Aspergillus cristatus TaxID=573508 RepID=A0A1E3BEA2_ASPCR|nr:hypothetical protein SI65_05920 [Aspergillus cristatus]
MAVLQNAHLTSQQPSDELKKPDRLSFQTILAEYLRLVEPVLVRTRDIHAAQELELDSALKEVFCERHLEYLAARQYGIADVMTWAWILKSNTVYDAIIRIFALEGKQGNQHHGAVRKVPTFIPLMLLRRSRFDARTFRLVLIYFLHLMSGEPIPTLRSALGSIKKETGYMMELQSAKRDSPIDASTCMLSVVRLLRHARQVWPQTQLTIARALADFLTHSSVQENCSEVSAGRINRYRAEKFNLCLWLLSLPSKLGPFVSASIQQQAQFELLKAMASHKPVLPVTRRGYQGVIAVQLAHKKTLAERQAAELKAPSWPPWKEEKLGIDSHRGIEGMTSRAMQVMTQMREAGYSHTRWEEVSSIFAGWDTDRSPTIQTRTLMRRPQSLPEPRGSTQDDQAIWVARIRATRTVREAWACFLSYQDQGLSPRLSIYTAMAEKLIFRRKAVEAHFDETSDALPGDGPEIFPEPASARDLIYVHSEPPTLDELLRRMLSDGIKPSGKLLELLLWAAPSFRSGLDYLRSSNLSNDQIESLCTVRGYGDHSVKQQRTLTRLPNSLFSSFVGFLCKYSNFNPLYLARSDIRTADLFPVVMGHYRAKRHAGTSTTLFENSQTGEDLQHPMTLSHAVQLVKLRNSQHPLPWIRLLSALGADRISVPYRKMSRTTQRVLAWHEVLEVARLMQERKIEMGLQGFQILCSTYAGAVSSGDRHPMAAEDGLELVIHAKRNGSLPHLGWVCETFEDMTDAGIDILKGYFDRLVLPDPATSPFHDDFMLSEETTTDSQETIPSMLHVPSPAVLHAFVRALGIAGDNTGLLSILQWMSNHASTLKEAADEYLNGERMMRRTLVAARVFVEGPPWGKPSLRDSNDPEKLVFPDVLVEEAYDIITETPLWDGWPSDEEVREYVNRETRL